LKIAIHPIKLRTFKKPSEIFIAHCMQDNFKSLREFSCQDKFKLSIGNNALAFVGNFTDELKTAVVGKTLYIPFSENHPAFTLIISGASLFGNTDKASLIVSFLSPAERDIVASYDFSKSIFYVER
jgi:hypothetical protein